MGRFGNDWGISQAPSGPGGRGTSFTTTGIQIVKESNYSQEAWEWLKFLLGSYDAVTRFIDITQRMPATVSAQAYFVDVVSPGTPHARVYYGALTEAGTTHRPLLPDWTTFAQLISGPYNDMLRGNVPPEQATEIMHGRMSGYLGENGL